MLGKNFNTTPVYHCHLPCKSKTVQLPGLCTTKPESSAGFKLGTSAPGTWDMIRTAHEMRISMNDLVVANCIEIEQWLRFKLLEVTPRRSCNFDGVQ
jgi:hypothetical protein